MNDVRMHGKMIKATEREADATLPVEALVLDAAEDRVRVRPVSAGAGTPGEITARVAVPGYAPAEGDRVIVQHVAGGSAYVIGVVKASRAPSFAIAPQAAANEPVGTAPNAAANEPVGTAPNAVRGQSAQYVSQIVTPSGVSASIEGEIVALRDAAGRLVVAFDGATGELSIAAEKDLRLVSREGRVVVQAPRDVAIEAGEAVRVSGASFVASVAKMALGAGHYELTAERIVEKTGEAFRTAETLLETRARHVRTLVSRTFEMLARRTTIASEEDTRIDGKRVLLG